MLSWIKFLKIVLPVATVATATVATVSLVSFRKEDDKKNPDNEDKVLSDFELKAKKFEEKVMLYSKDGKNESVTLENDALKDKILEKFKDGGELGDLAKELPNSEQIEKLLSEVKKHNSSLQNSSSNKDKENKGSSKQLDSESKASMKNNDEETSLEGTNVGAKQDEDIDSSKQITLSEEKEKISKKSDDEGESKKENLEVVSDKGGPEEDKPNNVDEGNDGQREQDFATTLKSNEQQRQDLNKGPEEDNDRKKAPQVAEEKGEGGLETQGSQTLDQNSSEQGLPPSSQEPSGELAVEGSVDGVDSMKENARGKKELSPDDAKRLEDLLGTVVDVANQLQTLVIDRN